MVRDPAARLVALSVLAIAAAITGCSTTAPLPPRAVELNRLGAAALGSGDLPTAEARLALAIEYSPRFTEAWVNLGLLELRRGERGKARKDIAHARSLNPDLPAPHHAMGLVEEREGRTRQAEASYRAALEVDPGFAPSRANLGRLLFAGGRFEDAREQFLRLTEVAPEALDGWLGLAESLARLGRERDCDLTTGRARRRFGDRPEIVVLVARQLLRRGAYGEAAEVLEPLASQGDPRRRAEAWAWLGVALLGEGDVDAAGRAAEQALALDAGDAVAAFVLGRARGAALAE